MVISGHVYAGKRASYLYEDLTVFCIHFFYCTAPMRDMRSVVAVKGAQLISYIGGTQLRRRNGMTGSDCVTRIQKEGRSGANYEPKTVSKGRWVGKFVSDERDMYELNLERSHVSIMWSEWSASDCVIRMLDWIRI
jgi:hypothetical protein